MKIIILVSILLGIVLCSSAQDEYKDFIKAPSYLNADPRNGNFLELERKKFCIQCPPYYSIICAYDGETYRGFVSSCFLRRFNCVYETNFKKVDKKYCDM